MATKMTACSPAVARTSVAATVHDDDDNGDDNDNDDDDGDGDSTGNDHEAPGPEL